MDELTEQTNVRLPKTLKQAIRVYIAADMHSSMSDFVKDALREKLKRDTPELYNRIVQANIAEALVS